MTFKALYDPIIGRIKIQTCVKFHVIWQIFLLAFDYFSEKLA